MNLVLIMGRLTRDAEMRQTSTGKTVTKLSVATNEKFGETERTEYHTVIAWEKAAERVGGLKKGELVVVQGRLQTRKWDKDGVEHKSTEIVSSSIDFLKPFSKPTPEPIDDTPIF
jgi:single-strand DNA-binding protein